MHPLKPLKFAESWTPCVTDNIGGLMKTRVCWCKKAKKTNAPLTWSAYKSFKREKCSSQCYVDSTKLLLSFQVQDKQSPISDLNEDLLNVRNWCFNNYLLLNPTKSKLMVFASTQMLPRLQDVTVSLLGKDPIPVHEAKGLGVTLDPYLTYNEHIIKTVSACMSCLGQINRVKHAFDKRTLLIIINR